MNDSCTQARLCLTGSSTSRVPRFELSVLNFMNLQFISFFKFDFSQDLITQLPFSITVHSSEPKTWIKFDELIKFEAFDEI